MRYERALELSHQKTKIIYINFTITFFETSEKNIYIQDGVDIIYLIISLLPSFLFLLSECKHTVEELWVMNDNKIYINRCCVACETPMIYYKHLTVHQKQDRSSHINTQVFYCI